MIVLVIIVLVALRICAQSTIWSVSRVRGCSRLISSVSLTSPFSTRAAKRASASAKLSAVRRAQALVVRARVHACASERSTFTYSKTNVLVKFFWKWIE